VKVGEESQGGDKLSILQESIRVSSRLYCIISSRAQRMYSGCTGSRRKSPRNSVLIFHLSEAKLRSLSSPRHFDYRLQLWRLVLSVHPSNREGRFSDDPRRFNQFAKNASSKSSKPKYTTRSWDTDKPNSLTRRGKAKL
jgi:hypothetical protein